MAKRPYEVSLWTHHDTFISVLASSETPKLGEGYEARQYDGVNGEKKLTFTIPIKYYDRDTNEFVNNEKWYNAARKDKSLANEKKVKLIFDKLKKSGSNYIHEIHEFVIESLTEERTETELLCHVECVGAAFKELGKIGTELLLNLETAQLEVEGGGTVQPNIDYWLKKVFPPNHPEDKTLQWTYAVRMTNNTGLLADKIYEHNLTEDWEVVGETLVPIYATSAIEKERFIDVKDSNKYNITQDIAEMFQVFVTYKYSYTNEDEPFRPTKKEVIFYDEFISPTEYSITYANNETGLSRTSTSVDVTTKMFVDSIENETSDDGFVSIANARNNKTLDDFILNFDYFIQSGALTSSHVERIAKFEKDIRGFNQQLNTASETVSRLTHEIALLEADVSNYTNKRDSANDNILNIDSKLLGLDQTRLKFEVPQADILNTVHQTSLGLRVDFRSRGVLPTGITLRRSTETTNIASSHYDVILDNYGYAVALSIKPSSGLVDKTLIKLGYTYDLLSFYRSERSSYVSMKDAAAAVLARKEDALSLAKNQQAAQTSSLKTITASKKKEVDIFNNRMTPFLKEGRWSESSYKPSFQNAIANPIPLTYDPIALRGEATSSYVQGSTTVYYDYMIPPVGTNGFAIEDLVVVDTFMEGGSTIVRQLHYGAQWVPQLVYRKLVSPTQYNTLSSLTAANPSTGLAYYVKDTGIVYHKDGASWVPLSATIALVFDKDIKLTAAGHTFKIGTTTIPIGSRISNTGFTIAHRRWLLTKNGTPSAAALSNFQTNTVKIKRSGLDLDEFDDYNITHNGLIKSITFKINNKATHDTTAFIANYQLDVSAEQLYRDALDVSKTSAFPEVSYEVTFSYLRDVENILYSVDQNADKVLRLGDIVRITDYDLQIQGLRGIVTAIDVNLDTPEETTFTVENYKTKFADLFERIIASSEQMKTSGYLYEKVAGAFGAGMALNSSAFQNTINQGDLTFTSGSSNGVSFGKHGILAETLSAYPNGVKGQTLISGGLIQLSDSLDASGNRVWATALSPKGINANLIRTGRLDTELINIYSGDQIRFSWTAQGLQAYGKTSQGLTDPKIFVRYNEDGLLFSRNGKREVELGWGGLYLGSQGGSLELSAGGGLELYNSDTPRQLLIKLGGFGTPNALGAYPDYGMKFYKFKDNVNTETLISTNDGELWLKDVLSVGDNDGFVGLSGGGKYVTPSQFDVYDDGITYSGGDIVYYIDDDEVYECLIPSIGHVPTDTTYWKLYTGVTQYDPIRIWAGAETPAFAPFRVTHSGSMFASNADISGTVKALNGQIGGWIIGSGSLTDLDLEIGLSPTAQYAFWAGGTLSSGPIFYVTQDGKMYAQDAEITGLITADTGRIGNWNITTSGLVSSTAKTGMHSSSESGVIAFWAGDTVDLSPAFSVTTDGHLKATGANISGHIEAGSGEFIGTVKAVDGDIGGWKILSNRLVSDDEEVGMSALIGRTFWAGGERDGEGALAPPFYVTNTGHLEASDANISGKITAQLGYIAGWEITPGQLSTDDVYTGMSSTRNPDHYTFWAGRVDDADPKFYVTAGGALYAEDAHITGEVTATSGTFSGSIIAYDGDIGGWTIQSNGIVGPDELIGMSTNPLTPTFWSGGKRDENPIFRVMPNGELYATDAHITGTVFATDGVFSGTIYASLGEIGGWKIADAALYSSNYTVGLSSEELGAAIWLGGERPAVPYETTKTYSPGLVVVHNGVIYQNIKKSLNNTPPATGDDEFWARGSGNVAPFYVDTSGYLYAQNAEIHGAIYADRGYFAGRLGIGTGTPWSKTTNYVKDEKVIHNGETYIALKASLAVEPPNEANWDNVEPESYISGRADAMYSLKIGDKFTVRPDGTLETTDAIFSGQLIANTGTIAGWEIVHNILFSIDRSVGLSSEPLGATFWSGGSRPPVGYVNDGVYSPGMTVTFNGERYKKIARSVSGISPANATYWELDTDPTALFYVNTNGHLYSENATVKGHIEAETGYISGRLGIGPNDYSYIGADDDINLMALKIADDFTVTHTGTLSAKNAIIEGNITATTGSIGGLSGWQIESNLIFANNKKIGLYAGGTDGLYTILEGVATIPVRMWAGGYDTTSPKDTPFLISDSGALYASNAYIRGNIVAESGYIAKKMTVGDAANSIVMQVEYDGANQFKGSYIGSFQSGLFMSGPLTGGWMIRNDGSATFQDVTVRGAIKSSVFEYGKISAVGGSLYVAPTIHTQRPSQTIEYFDTPISRYEITFINDAGTNIVAGKTWSNDDEVILDFSLSRVLDEVHSLEEYSNVHGKIEDFGNTFIVISVPVVQTTENAVQYDLQLTDATINTRAQIIFYGTAGNRQGMLLTTINDGPYLDVYDNPILSTPMPEDGAKVRLGKLDGIVDQFFGGRLEGYGLYSQNAYLRGQLRLPGAGITNQDNVTYSFTTGLARAATIVEDLPPEELNSPIRIWAGMPYVGDTNIKETDINKARFIVTENGFMYATAGSFSGVINATDGIFSGVLKSAGLIIYRDQESSFPYIPTWEQNFLHDQETTQHEHFYVAYKKNPQNMNDYVLDISPHGLSIWEGGLRAFSDWESGWRDGDKMVDGPSATRLSPYGYAIEDVVSPYPYMSLVDNDHPRLTARYGHFVEIVRNGISSHNYHSISNKNGRWIFTKGLNTNLHGPSYESLEKAIYDAPSNHSIGPTTLFDALSIDSGGKGLFINTNGVAPTYVGLKESEYNNEANPPNSALNVKGEVHIFNRDIGGKGKLILGYAQIREALDGNSQTIGIDITV